MFDDAPAPIDAIDAQLLDALQQDCKTPLAKLGARVGLSAPSVMERIRKLEQAGVIRGYEAQLDARRIGLDITAFVWVALNYPRHKGAFEDQVVQLPEVLECHHVTGGSTLLLKVRARNTQELEGIISTLRGIDGVERTETNVVLSTQKERTRVPVPAPAAGHNGKPRRPRRPVTLAAPPPTGEGPRSRSA
jgi:Lrp/AsnC family leucine-responsive transcriptional regulator